MMIKIQWSDKMAKQAIGYVRVSTEQQATEGVSLEAQIEKIKAYAVCYGYDLIDIQIDAGASASTLERAGLQVALAALRAGNASTLIVAKLDRLTRSVRDLDALLSNYFANTHGLVSVAEQVDTSTATGRMILNVLMSVSQWEREVISERTKAAMAHKKSKGEYIGGHVPFGYSVEDGKLIEDPAEQAIIAMITEARAAGKSYRAIAEKFNEANVPRRDGTSWHVKAVQRALSK
jgi:DNA invertase Pin-like site-specific DNA recombinase